jgi:anti-sigma B factor antagonist
MSALAFSFVLARVASEYRPGAVQVDLSGLTHCGSAGLAALADARDAAAAAGVGFTAVNPRPHARRVIEISGLRGFLALHQTEDKAL